MSIWSSWEHIGYDSTVDEQKNGNVRAYADGWSNHFPTTDIEAPACVDLATIPVWCVPGHQEDFTDELDLVGPWIRLGISSPAAVSWWEKDPDGNPVPDPQEAVVVLDETAARALRDQLTEWLDRGKAQPA